MRLTREQVEVIAEVAKGGYPLIEQDGAELCLDELAADWLEQDTALSRSAAVVNAAREWAAAHHNSCCYPRDRDANRRTTAADDALRAAVERSREVSGA